jgi:phage-related baseplate assembly protein
MLIEERLTTLLRDDRPVCASPPDIIETLDYEAIVSEMRDDLVARFPLIAGVIDLESEPARKLIEAFAYRELRLRARINDGARAVLLASSYGTNLDHLAACSHGAAARRATTLAASHSAGPEASRSPGRRVPTSTRCSPLRRGRAMSRRS